MNVRELGAKGDGITDDTAAIQRAIDLSFGSAAAPHGTRYNLNRPLYFPAGHYLITAPLRFTKLVGGQITGDGRFVTTIENRSGSGVISTNGCAYSHWQGMTLAATGSATVFDLNWDNSSGGVALQSNTFEDVAFGGAAIGIDIGAGGFMGSENLFLNCKWQHQTVAGLKTSNYNALENTIVGGNISFESVGVWIQSGTVSLYNVSFQRNTKWDILQENSAYAAIVVSGSRTESANFFSGGNGMTVMLEGVSQDTDSEGVFVSHTGLVSIQACHSRKGQVVGNIVGTIQSSTFDRNDWLKPNNRTNLTLSGIRLPSSFIDQAKASATGISLSTQPSLPVSRQ